MIDRPTLYTRYIGTATGCDWKKTARHYHSHNGSTRYHTRPTIKIETGV
jgi:hypothetical protein